MKVTLKKVIAMAMEDERLFNGLNKDPKKTLLNRNLILSPRDLARLKALKTASLKQVIVLALADKKFVQKLIDDPIGALLAHDLIIKPKDFAQLKTSFIKAPYIKGASLPDTIGSAFAGIGVTPQLEPPRQWPKPPELPLVIFDLAETSEIIIGPILKP
jgi:hypothetical protein